MACYLNQAFAQPTCYRPLWPGFRHPCRNDGFSGLPGLVYDNESRSLGTSQPSLALLRCVVAPLRETFFCLSHNAAYSFIQHFAMQPRPVISPETPAGADLFRPTAVANSTALGGMAGYGALSWPKQTASMAGAHLTFMSIRIDAPTMSCHTATHG